MTSRRRGAVWAVVFSCKACGANLDENRIQLDTGLGTCDHCRTITSFAKELGLRESSAEPVEPRSAILQPEDVHVEDTATHLRLSKRWYQPGLFFLFFFCIAWNAFLIGWYAIGSSASMPFGFKLIMMVFPIAHVAVGVGLTYKVLTGFLNRTVVEVLSHQLSLHHTPLPWKGNRTMATSEIKQLFCRKRRRSRNQQGVAAFGNYDLVVVLHSGKQVILVKGENDLDHLLYLEQQIEKRLGIKDQAMRHEAPR